MTNNKKQHFRGRIIASLALTALLSLVAYATLLALPALAADDRPLERKSNLPPGLVAVADVFTITGTVSDTQSVPIADVQVFASSGEVISKTLTDGNGFYTLILNADYHYDIVFNPPAGAGLAPQFRRGINATHQHNPLNVTLPPGYTISGTVYSDVAKLHPVAGVAIYASNKGTYDGFGLPLGEDDGTYHISLEAGTWDLTFTPKIFPPPLLSMGLGPTQTTVVLTEDINLDIILSSGFAVYGQVTASGGDGQANAQIFAQDPSQPNGYGFTPTGPGGYYTGSLPAGTFDIQFIAPRLSGLGSDVVTNVTGPPDIEFNHELPFGYTVSGTIRYNGHSLTNALIYAAPHPPIPGDDLGGWGQFADTDGFYALALQPGIYTFTVSPPDATHLPRCSTAMVEIQQDMTLDFDCRLIFLPLIAKCWPHLTNGPMLKPIVNNGDGNYTVSWDSPCPGEIFTYTLQEDDDPTFSSPNQQITTQTVYTVTGRVRGTYYYRVKATSNQGTTPWSNVQTATVTHLTIDDFDDGRDPNAVGGPINMGWPTSCSQTISGGYVGGDSGYVYYLTYHVTPECYGVWETGLLNQSYQGFSRVTFEIKGALGNERPHVWLQDTRDCQIYPDCRHYVEVGNFLPARSVTTQWQQASIPLSIFEGEGVHLTSLQFFQIAFEWTNMNGTIYIDDIRFE